MVSTSGFEPEKEGSIPSAPTWRHRFKNGDKVVVVRIDYKEDHINLWKTVGLKGRVTGTNNSDFNIQVLFGGDDGNFFFRESELEYCIDDCEVCGARFICFTSTGTVEGI